MSGNVVSWTWNTQRETAARLVADGQLTEVQIGAQVGITDRQLERWKKHSDFAVRVQEHVEAQREAIKNEGIANRQNRVAALNDRWRRMQTVLDERAEDPSLAMVPGGSTGLIVHDVKGVGKGEDFQLIDIYGVDVGLLKEFREHEKQAATEVGQWSEKRELTGSDGAPIVFTIAIDRNEPDADSDI